MNRLIYTVVCCGFGISLTTVVAHAADDAAAETDIGANVWRTAAQWLKQQPLVLAQIATIRGPAKPAEQSAPDPQATKPNRRNNGAKFGWEERDDAQYATFRSRGNVYFKGKAGYVVDDELDYEKEESIDEWMNTLDQNGAVGLGAGYKLSNGEVVEFEYTVNKRDEKLFSIGYTF